MGVTQTGTTQGGSTNPIQQEIDSMGARLNMIETVIKSLVPVRVLGNTGKQYKIVACTLRNTGSGWFAINDSNHLPINVASVSNDTGQITVNYNFTAKKVGSFVACPDETLVQTGYNFGSTVGLSSAGVIISQERSIGGYVYYNGSAWTNLYGDGITGMSFSGGVLTVTHDTIYGLSAAVSCRNGLYDAYIGSTTNTTTEIYVMDHSGALVTTPDANMRFYFTRHSKTGALNPNVISSVGGNVWCLGIFEV